MRAVLIVALTTLPSKLLACTPAPGVDRAAFYAAIERPPYVLGGLSVLAAALWLVWGRRRLRSGFVGGVLVVLAILQPAWWLHSGGDCGALRDVAAFGVACVSLALIAVGFWREGRRRRASRSADPIAGV